MINGSKQITKIATIFLLTLTFYMYANGQDMNPKSDSLKQYFIDEVVITANRYDNKILNTGSSMAVMDAPEINALPVATLSEALNYMPGLYIASNDGMGLNPQVSLRGFYGGGEAEYVTVLVDGIPINNLATGLADYNLVPLNGATRIELLRGGSSPLYGDAAMGGVINIRTVRSNPKFTSASLGYGQYNSYNIGAAHGGAAGNGTYELYVSNTATDGFRDHSRWNSINFGGKVKLPLSRNSSLTFSTFNQILSSQDPGFWSDTLTSFSRDASQPYFRDDGNDYKKFLAGLQFRTQINPQTSLITDLNYQHNNRDKTRTYGQYPIILVPVSNYDFVQSGVFTDTSIYADTKKRELTTDQVNFAVRVLDEIPEAGIRITGGIEAGYGNYNNNYRDVFRGFMADYEKNYAPWDSLDTKGSGFRFTSAAYLGGQVKLLDPLSLIVGLRYDFISDDYNGDVPDTTMSKTNSAFSPKLGLNLSTGSYDNYSGSIYVSFSRSFKAPTIDQRTDLKHLYYYAFMEAGPAYIPFEIKAEPFANAALKPQISNSYEIGTYQSYRFSEDWQGELSLTGYLTKVTDEIDFDLATRKYRNIVNTEHTGLETGIHMNYRNNSSAFISYTYSEVRFSDGELEGRQLKGIPSNVYAVGLNHIPDKGIGGSLTLMGASGIYLDDENTRRLDGYAVLNARISYRIGFARIYIDINNIFDKKYNSTGYLVDGISYLYPAMGRFVKGGIDFHF